MLNLLLHDFKHALDGDVSGRFPYHDFKIARHDTPVHILIQ